MERKFCFIPLFCDLVIVVLLVFSNSINAYTHFSRFSDVLRKGSLWNPEPVYRPSPIYHSSVADNEASAGTLQSSIVGPPRASSHISSGFSPVTFTSRVQLPQFRAEDPNKENGYSYRTAFPIQNGNPHQPVHPVVLQPIIQYFIQIPPHKQFGHNNGNALPHTINEKDFGNNAVILDSNMEPSQSTSNLNEDMIQMMEEASGGEEAESNNEPLMSAMSATAESAPNDKIPVETMDNLMSIIEHMNNVSDSNILANSQQFPPNSGNSSEENNHIMYGNPQQSSSEGTPDNGYQYQYANPNSNTNVHGGYSGSVFEAPIPNKKFRSEDNNRGYYPSENRNIIRDGYLKSSLRSLQPGPEETEEAISLFSHLSDQIFRDLNKESYTNKNADTRDSSAMGSSRSSTYSNGKQEAVFDPHYGESAAYYTSYSNQRPPLDSELYQTLQTILRNK